jgi:hypothetical protein
MPKLTQNSVETSRIENRDLNLPNAPQLVNFEALDDAGSNYTILYVHSLWCRVELDKVHHTPVLYTGRADVTQ